VHRLAHAALEQLAALGVVADLADRRVPGARGERDGVQAHELAPHHLRLRLEHVDRHARAGHQRRESLDLAVGRRDVDSQERA
jgi:hypothetical protein